MIALQRPASAGRSCQHCSAVAAVRPREHLSSLRSGDAGRPGAPYGRRMGLRRGDVVVSLLVALLQLLGSARATSRSR